MEANSLSFKDLFLIVRRFWILLLIVTVIGAACGFIYASATLDPLYSASVQLKVHNYTNKDDTFINTNSEFELAEKLKAGYILTVTESYDYLKEVLVSLTHWEISEEDYLALEKEHCENISYVQEFEYTEPVLIGYENTGNFSQTDNRPILKPLYEEVKKTRPAYFLDVLSEYGYRDQNGVITLTPSAIRSMISISEDENATNFFKITVSSTNKQFALYLTQALEKVLIEDFVDYGSVITNSAPRASDGAYYPRNKYTAIATVASFVLCYGVLLLIKLFNTKINSEDDLKRISDLPLLASIPDFTFGKQK